MAQQAQATSQEVSKKWAQVVAQAWGDASFKKRLTDNPAAVLREYGIIVPAGMEIRVVENTGNVRYLTLPPKPAGAAGEISSEHMQNVVGGSFNSFLSYGSISGETTSAGHENWIELESFGGTTQQK